MFPRFEPLADALCGVCSRGSQRSTLICRLEQLGAIELFNLRARRSTTSLTSEETGGSLRTPAFSLVFLRSPKPFEPIRQFWAAFSLVRELGDEQRKRLGVAGDV